MVQAINLTSRYTRKETETIIIYDAKKNSLDKNINSNDEKEDKKFKFFLKFQRINMITESKKNTTRKGKTSTYPMQSPRELASININIRLGFDQLKSWLIEK